MLYLITKSGNLFLQKILFFFKVNHFRFAFCDFIKLGKNSRFLSSPPLPKKRKFLIEVEITMKSYSSHFHTMKEDLMYKNLFYFLYYRYFVNPSEIEQDRLEDKRLHSTNKSVYFKSHLEMVFLFQISEWTSKFTTYRIILTLRDLQSKY
jgi:hypothetical protein